MNKRLKTVYVDPAILIPWDKNPRKGLDAAASKLAKSIEQVGFINPIIATPDNIVRAGHTRLKAALKLKLTEVPVIYVPFWSEDEAELYAVGDNRAGEWTSWDRGGLAEVLSGLKHIDIEQLNATTTFSKQDILNLQATHDLKTSRADMKEKLEEAAGGLIETDIQLGDIYQLGKHYLMCGDAGNAEHVATLMDGNLADLVNTDPPYGVDAHAKTRVNRSVHAAQEVLEGKRELRARDVVLKNDEFADFTDHVDGWVKSLSSVMRPGATAYIWGGYSNLVRYPDLMVKHGISFKQLIIWLKNMSSVPMNFKGFRRCFEVCYYGFKEGATPYFDELLNLTVRDAWEVDVSSKTSVVHLTEKPLGLATKAMECSSKHGDLVVDLFGGSGSTLIAGEALGRRVRMMELNPQYCQVIIDRWTKMQEGVA